MKVTITERTASRMIFFIQKLTMKPIINPKIGPPIETLIKLAITPTTVACSPLTKLINSMKKTIAVPSFNSDYPSTSVLNFTLAPNSFNNATTATGSVAERTHPKAQASYQVSSSSPYPRTTLKQNAMIIAPQSTPGPARRRMLKRDLRKTCQSQLKAE